MSHVASGSELARALHRSMRRVERARRAVLRAPEGDATHGLRTAIRRARAVLSALPRESVSTAERRRLVERLRRLFRAAGVVRDLDVGAALLEAHVDSLTAPLRTRVAARRARAQARLHRRAAAREIRAPHVGVLSSRSAAASLRARERTLSKRFDRDLRRAQRDATSAHLHAARKACKRLRYLLELCDDEVAAQRRRALARTQDELGAIHDLDLALGLVARLAPHAGVRAGASLERARIALSAERAWKIRRSIAALPAGARDADDPPTR